jgi:predicted PurR-regulated permease PerM
MERMFRKVGDTVYATVCGTLAVSAVQGLLGGLMFWILGLPAPLLWGVIMALLAIVPVLGPFVIWIPAALYLVIQGSMWKALILVVWGVLVVGTSDNLLRPVFVGQRLKIHTLSVFVSVVGGVIAFGASGIVLGPVILAITTELLEVWHRRAAAGS